MEQFSPVLHSTHKKIYKNGKEEEEEEKIMETF